MKTINQQIDSLFNQADKLVIVEVERLARNVLLSNNKAHSFMMAMGTYFFMDKDRNNLNNFDSKRLDNFIMKYDRKFKVTGYAMTFTAKGKIIYDW